MKERPILFSSPMIRAIMSGTKTQTRRIIKGAPLNPESYLLGCHKGVWGIHADVEKDDGVFRFQCPYGVPGDRLWVRESISKPFPLDVEARCFTGFYRASEPERKIQWIPSIHMPRWASRITLEVVSVRVERLQEISEADAYREGVIIPSHHAFASNGNPELRNEARTEFAALWHKINGPGLWDANPWVWVVEFKRVEVAA